MPPILCLTATAKPEVVRDIRDHFKNRLGIGLILLDGGAVRTNLCHLPMTRDHFQRVGDILAQLGEAIDAARLA
ncbi:hypothetical protein GCM10007973_03300 [Polymorphobacter multimanifer]|nr:hypothetical protein GCM10007973_03300 [Polymorphobacter multimanifer]